MTIQDSAIPNLADALTQRRVRRLTNEHLIPEWFPGSTLASMSLLYTRYKANKSHVALYRLHLDPPSQDEAPLVTITFGRPKLLSRVLALAETADRPEQGSTICPTDIPCLAQLFPADYQLPTLWHAADRERATRLLGAMLPDHRRLGVRSIDILRYRPGRRCVLAYEIETKDAAFEAIGKLYTRQEQAAAVADKLSLLSSRASRSPSFPTLLGQPGGSPLLLMPKLRGANLGDLLEQAQNADDIRRALRSAAAALRAFHDGVLDGQPTRTLHTELADLADRIQPMRSVAPRFAARMDGLLSRLAGLVSITTRTEEACAIHGEYKPNQLLLDGDRIAIVDLDRACNGDPACDVGNFMAVLRKEALVNGHAQLADADTEFAHAYGEATDRPELLRRARVAQAVATLRSLARSFERRPRQFEIQGDAWRPLVLLTEVERLLESM